MYKTEEKMNQFYHLLVKESLDNEDVAALSRDNVRDCHEIDQAFKTSNDCYNSYVYRDVVNSSVQGDLSKGKNLLLT